MPISTTVLIGSSFFGSRTPSSVPPSISSIAMYGWPPSSPTSKTVTMFGCDSTPAPFASRRNRTWYSESPRSCDFRNLIASSRSMSGS